jgi:hypothetical protein
MKKGERKQELAVGARAIVNKKTLGAYNGRIGTVVESVFDSRYGVKFDNSKEPIIYLDSACLSNYSAGLRSTKSRVHRRYTEKSTATTD